MHRIFLGLMLLLFALGAVYLFWPGTDPEIKEYAPKANTLIFVDASRSASSAEWPDQEITSFLEEKYTESLGVVSGYLLHKSTSGKQVFRVDFNTPQCKDLCDRDEKSEIECRPVITDCEEKRKATAMRLETGMKELFTQKATGADQWTNIWGALHTMQQTFPAGEQKQVIFCSDMKQSMSSNRDFDQQMPASMQEARQWAKEDIEQIKSTYPNLKDGVLGSTQVTVFFPSQMNADLDILKAYWNTIFEAFGINFIKTHLP